MRKLNYFILMLALLVFASCQKDDEPKEIVGNVDIYLLDSYETTGIYGEIVGNSVVLESEPFIPYAEIISYDKNEYVFEISEDAIQTIQSEQFPLNGLAFAITANENIVYTGYFWNELSSSICGWPVIQSTEFTTDNHFSLNVKLGHPENLISVPDKRNDSKILDIFRRDNKLIE